MGTKQIIPCAICTNLQLVDVELFYTTLSAATKIPIQEVRLTNYEFICSACSETPKYKTDYFSDKSRPHAVLAKEASIGD